MVIKTNIQITVRHPTTQKFTRCIVNSYCIEYTIVLCNITNNILYMISPPLLRSIHYFILYEYYISAIYCFYSIIIKDFSTEIWFTQPNY